MLSTNTKVKLDTKAATQGLKRPGTLQIAYPVTKGGLKLAKPFAKRRARKRVERTKIAVPVLAAGALLGAGAFYFLEPRRGSAHRAQVARLVSK